MTNIWKYDGTGSEIVITTIDGNRYAGRVAAVDAAEEDDAPEDSISLYIGEEIIQFFSSEIENIVLA